MKTICGFEDESSLHWKDLLTSGIVGKSLFENYSAAVDVFLGFDSVILWAIARLSLVSLLSGVLNIFFTLGSVPPIFTVERVGRRPVLSFDLIGRQPLHYNANQSSVSYNTVTNIVLVTIFTDVVAIGTGNDRSNGRRL